MSHRTKQIESTLQRAVSQVLLRRLADPRIGGLVSVTEVKVSPDLRRASVHVSVLPAQFERKVLAALENASGHIQTSVRKLVSLRNVPVFDFCLDDSLKRQAAIYSAIHDGIERSGPIMAKTPDESAHQEEV